MAATTLSAADRKLNQAQQAEILRLKQAWADASAAGNTQAMEQAHAAAEAIRSSAGYSGGSDGSAEIRTGSTPGYTAAQVQDWVREYERINYSDKTGWTNGYSTAMNQRSVANFIRQQMQANSEAWAGADQQTRDYLHDQNLQLAGILANAVGGAESTYNEALGRWETYNANLGYGVNMTYAPGVRDREFAKTNYGMTDEQMDAYFNDTDRYRNYVDQRVVRNWVDESSGYTGIYSQFVNGPYARLLTGTKGVDQSLYMDVIGDGFAEGSYADRLAAYQTGGPQAPALKYNNGVSDYTGQFTSYVDENGIIQPGQLVLTHPGGGKQQNTGVQTGGTSHSGGTAASGTGSSGLLEAWKEAASQQAVNTHSYAVDQAVAQLLQAQQEADAAYRSQQDQIAREERNALDNSALYAELRGDRGGIGQAQYNQVQAQAAANRQTVQAAQTKLAADTQQQIAQLRAQGQFETADALLEVSQTYLLKLLALEQWAAEYQLNTQKFQADVEQWEQEYMLKIAQLLK